MYWILVDRILRAAVHHCLSFISLGMDVLVWTSCLGYWIYVYEPEVIIVWVFRLLKEKSFVVLKYASLTNDDTGKYVFEHGINRLRKICSHMSPTFPFIEAFYPIFVGQLMKPFQLHLTYSHEYPKMSPVHLLRVCVTYKYSINLLRYEI